MDLFLDTQIAVPIFQIALLLVLSTLALLFGRVKLALVINYCFTLYWGLLLSVSFFSDKGTPIINNYSFAYLGFGLVIVILVVVGFFINE